jgi:hypothetical protein
MGVSNPTNFVHKIHVGFDPVSGAFTVSIECLLKPLRLRFGLGSGSTRTMDSIAHILVHHSRGLRQKSTSCFRGT